MTVEPPVFKLSTGQLALIRTQKWGALDRPPMSGLSAARAQSLRILYGKDVRAYVSTCSISLPSHTPPLTSWHTALTMCRHSCEHCRHITTSEPHNNTRKEMQAPPLVHRRGN